MKYHKINSLYKRNEKGKIIEGNFVNETFEELYNSNYRFEYTEKVDGTNIRVIITKAKEDSGFYIELAGRTDNAIIPDHLLTKLDSIFNDVDWNKIFDWERCSEVILYGEGFGHGIQGCGDKYNKEDVDFVLFDLMIDGIFMNSDWVTNVATYLGIHRAEVLGVASLKEIEEFVKSKPCSKLAEDPNFPMEGVVCRPIGDLKDKLGNRIITKIKYKDYI
jgi:ATP-dependent RNA circularization protein (DNA/RNA ligase family)